MPKSTKIQDFRNIKFEEEATPIETQKNKRVASNKKKTKNNKTTKTKKDTKNKPKNEHRLLKTTIVLVLISIGVIAGCMLTPTFNLQEITAKGQEKVSKEEIKNKLEDSFGINIFKLNTSKLEKKVEEIPYIKDATIYINLPNSLNVKIEERKPYAIIKYLESYVVMDKYGYVLEILKENTYENLPIIYGIDAAEYILGQKLKGTEELKYDNIAHLLETIEKTNFSYTVYEINYEDTENLVMAIKESAIDIDYGKIEKTNLNEKIVYLEGILKKLSNEKGRLDISSEKYQEKTIFKKRQ